MDCLSLKFLFVLLFRSWITVGGIRSTGVSSCLGIAKEVHHLIADKLFIVPKGGGNNWSAGKINYWVTDKSSVIMDGNEYPVTHLLSKFGLVEHSQKRFSKL